jgi:hypothetical protein
VEGRGSPHRVDAAEEPANPFPIIAGPELGPTAATAREYGISKRMMDMQGHAVPEKGRDHRYFLQGQFAGESVFFANRGIRPSARPVKLGDHRFAILDPDLVHPIFITVERQNSAVAAMAHGLNCV